jgi:hypothetical protein
MKFAKVKKGEHFSYSLSECDDRSLTILVRLLTHMTDLSYDLFTEWLKGTKYTTSHAVGGFVCGLWEKEGRVYVYCYFDCPRKRFKNFSTTKENMLRIIEDWVHTAYQMQQPNEILISQQNENIKFTVEE